MPGRSCRNHCHGTVPCTGCCDGTTRCYAFRYDVDKAPSSAVVVLSGSAGPAIDCGEWWFGSATSCPHYCDFFGSHTGVLLAFSQSIRWLLNVAKGARHTRPQIVLPAPLQSDNHRQQREHQLSSLLPTTHPLRGPYN